MRLPGFRATAVCALVGVVALVSLAPRAHAQATPPYDPAIDVQLFDFAVGPKTFFTVADGDVAAKGQMSFDAMVTFLTNPFTVYGVDPTTNMLTGARSNVVSSLVGGQVSGAYGVTDSIQVGAILPLIFSMSGQGLDVGNATPASQTLQTTGLGDLRVEAKDRLWQSGPFRFAALASLGIPSRFGTGANGAAFTGNNVPDLRLEGALQWRSSDEKLSAGANLGVLLQDPHTIYGSTIGQQLVWGVAGAYSFTDTFQVVGEVFGRAGFDYSQESAPTEAVGGVRVLATQSFAVVAGGGGGLFKGVGSPDVRAFVSIGYAPDTRDSDGDGIPNNRDRCPLVPEDHDGFQDADGCPDDDNDGDGVPDAQDKCPDKPEDHDGFQDEDGCPDLDNDGDGIADLDDRCPLDKEDGKPPYPNDGCPADKRDSDGDGVMDSVDACPDKAEDQDGFEDADGCPDPDNDGDGIADADDKCPNCAEDKDGIQDADGCPETDADHDGIPDDKDKCPLEAETINGIDDWDGCPDQGGVQIANLEGDRLTFLRQPSFKHAELDHGGQVIVDQAALVLLSHPEVTHWTLAVGAATQRDADREAASVQQRLTMRGVPASLYDVVARPGAAEIGFVVRDRVDPDHPPPFVCPAGMEAKPRPHPATPPPSPTTVTPVSVPPKPAPPATTPPATTPPKPPPPAPPKPPPPAPPAKQPNDGASDVLK
jgi:hypothetical protein